MLDQLPLLVSLATRLTRACGGVPRAQFENSLLMMKTVTALRSSSEYCSFQEGMPRKPLVTRSYTNSGV